MTANVNGDNLEITFDIKNIGAVDGKETAQVYIGKKQSFFERPIKELKGFAKPEIKAGASEKVCITIPLSDIAVYDTTNSKWTVEPGEYRIYVGASSQDIRLTDSITV